MVHIDNKFWLCNYFNGFDDTGRKITHKITFNNTNIQGYYKYFVHRLAGRIERFVEM